MLFEHDLAADQGGRSNRSSHACRVDRPDPPGPDGTTPRSAAALPDDPRLLALRARIDLAPEVAAALAAGRPVVALESTLISHGLPHPQNLEVAAASEAAVRDSDAVPASVAIHDGRIIVGLDAAALLALATMPGVRKVARPTLAGALAAGGWGATTVSATMLAAHAAGVRVFATGGIGGVHAGAFEPSVGPDNRLRPPSLDVSVDLDELARTPVVVVCAGPKAILDVPATLQVLETRGVPVVTIGTEELPGFFSRGSGIPAPQAVPDEAAAAALAAVHLELLGTGVLVCVPVPAADELPRPEAVAAIARAIAEAEAAGIHGPALTPWVLRRVADLTDGRSVRANTALIINDARVAGRLAAILARS
ncbi:MAG: pseudouridine-5'-phosphate glycosidase [Chloroflexota bacterium]